MSDIAKALVHRVTTSAGVAALIGARFYDMKLPQTVTFPAVTYQMIPSGEMTHHHEEISVLPRFRVQITIYGVMGRDDLHAVDDAIKTAIDGFRGSWGVSPYTTIVERCVAETTPYEGYDPDSGLYYTSRDYMIMHKE